MIQNTTNEFGWKDDGLDILIHYGFSVKLIQLCISLNFLISRSERQETPKRDILRLGEILSPSFQNRIQELCWRYQNLHPAIISNQMTLEYSSQLDVRRAGGDITITAHKYLWKKGKKKRKPKYIVAKHEFIAITRNGKCEIRIRYTGSINLPKWRPMASCSWLYRGKTSPQMKETLGALTKWRSPADIPTIFTSFYTPR